MQPSISKYLHVEADQIDSPESEIIKIKTIEGRRQSSYLPISHDGVMNKYFTDVAGHELGGPTTILWVSNLCVQMGKFYAPGLGPKSDNPELGEPRRQLTPTKSTVKFFEIKRPSFLITPHQAGHNFFHFLIDSLPRFHFKEKFARFSTPVLFSGSRQSFQDNTMKVLLHKKHPIHETSDRLLLRECALTWPAHRTAAIDFLRKKSAPVATDNRAKRIYISRRNASYRQVINENELEPILKKFSFTIIECENIDFYNQISLFKSAEIICGPHGAGLTNIAFCQKGASVLEIIMEERVCIGIGAVFWELACAADLDYHIVSARRIPVDEANQHDGAMYVDPQKFEAALDHLIKYRK